MVMEIRENARNCLNEVEGLLNIKKINEAQVDLTLDLNRIEKLQQENNEKRNKFLAMDIPYILQCKNSDMICNIPEPSKINKEAFIGPEIRKIVYEDSIKKGSLMFKK